MSTPQIHHRLLIEQYMYEVADKRKYCWFYEFYWLDIRLFKTDKCDGGCTDVWMGSLAVQINSLGDRGSGSPFCLLFCSLQGVH